jgi:hypothetical protein
MLKRIYGDEVQQMDLAPQAVIMMSVAQFRKQSGVSFKTGSDDLNNFEAAFFLLDGTNFALVHHVGEPENTMNLYLDRAVRPDVRRKIVRRIAKELQIAECLVGWQEETQLT